MENMVLKPKVSLKFITTNHQQIILLLKITTPTFKPAI